MKTHALANPLQRDAAGETEIHDLQRALQSAKLYHGPIDGVFGAGTADACKQAKWQFGYPAKAVLETGGQMLYDFLTGTKQLPLAFRIRRKARGYGMTKDERIRAGIVSYCAWGVKNTLEIHYAEIRPYPRDPHALPMTTDCSGFSTLAYKAAGGPDPNGQGFSGQGYTGTLLDHGKTVPLFQAENGDLVIWGSPPGHHVAVITDTSNKADPLICSHGNEQGPLAERLSAETAAQQRSYVVKRYLKT